MAHRFKRGDKVIANKDNDYCKKGDVVTLSCDDGTNFPRFQLASGETWRMSEYDFDPYVITFEHMFSRIKKYLPTASHHKVGARLRFYRNDCNDYIGVQVDGFDISAGSYQGDILAKSIGLQVHWREALRLLDEYEAEQEPVEMTIKEIADKLGIDSSKLRVKDDA